MIDRKYIILAVNPCNGHIHTQADSLLLSADDKAVPIALRAYLEECGRLNCGSEHLESVALLIDRIEARQLVTGGKIPDTDTPCEIDRCIGGKI